MVRLKTVVLILVFLATVSVHADSTQNAEFVVDWEHMKLRVFGSSQITSQDSGNVIEWQLKAARSAEQNLLRSFIDAMKYLQMDGYQTAHEVLLHDLERNEQIYRYCNRIKARSIRYNETSATVEKTFDFFGSDGFIPILFKAGKDTGNFPEYDSYVFSTSFSGFVIDARGLNRKTAIAPRIFDQEHNLVYSTDLMERYYFTKWGAVQYVTDPNDRRIGERVGENPFRIVAIPDNRLLDTDMTIFTEDAWVLLRHQTTKSNLQMGRVVIITDSIENED
jgi:hypothetical protein